MKINKNDRANIEPEQLTTEMFVYKEVPFNPERDKLIDLINNFGKMSWRFHSMAQRITPGTHDLRTGQPKIEIVLILEKKLFNPFDN